MKLFKKIIDIQGYLNRQRENHLTIGFVPTMGALHAGHLRLLEACKAQCDVVVVSIFVNPTQFNDPKDLEKYPRTIDTDLAALLGAGCDVLFYPDTTEIYPTQEITRIYDLGTLEHQLEGAYRPGHFQGVCQVVDRLFEIVQPERVFFGQKDYQQCMVIKRLIARCPAHKCIRMEIVPTMREPSGLAMSSRNRRLSAPQQAVAATIYQNLLLIQQQLQPGSTEDLTEQARRQLEASDFEVDYVTIADAGNLTPVAHWDGIKPLVALVAAYLGGVRLIDNLVIA